MDKFDYEKIKNSTLNEVGEELFKRDTPFPYLAKTDAGEVLALRADKLNEFITQYLNRYDVKIIIDNGK